MRRRSLQPQQQVPTIAENGTVATPKIELNGGTLSKGTPPNAAVVNGHVDEPVFANGVQGGGQAVTKGQMPQSVSLPVLKLGGIGGQWASSGTLKGLMNGNDGVRQTNGSTAKVDQQQQNIADTELTASPIEIRDAINGTARGGGGFVGGRKLEMLLQRDRTVAEVARV